MTIGGLFDFVSGYAKRAPECLRKWKMEWAYRMIHNPKRHVSKNVRNLHFFPLLVSDYLASRNTGAKT